MILGIGVDICDIRRIERVLDRFGERFVARIFTAEERRAAERRKGGGAKVVAGTFAKRFAAKEAAVKALGTGFRSGVFHRDVEIVNLATGQPVLRFAGGALRRFEALIPDGMEPRVHVTMTDEYPYAEAYVLIEAASRQ